ncbi:hypothetical protein RND81_13G114900 [Saponaria officinalis]|uniref:Uncharacterized protein n=1 Tax=Saponaria officinalis TaxID=3572 RepID=A0AAW1GWP5_SAPOF
MPEKGDDTVKNIVNPKEKTKKTKSAGDIISKCRSKTLVKIIQNLTEEQRAAVVDIGFGGLLELKIEAIPMSIVPMIVNYFEHNSYMLKPTITKEFLLSKYDVFCLPKEGDRVQLTATGNSKQSQEDNLKNEWRLKFGVEGNSNGIKMNELANRLMECRESGDKFKKMFVVYSMSSFLAPVANYFVDFKLLRAVEDVNRIRHMDWCSYIFDQVVESVRKVKKGNTFFCGCTLFLIISYFHRIEYRGQPMPHSIPLIKHWTEEMFNERAKAESDTGCLGSGLVARITFPICLQSTDKRDGKQREVTNNAAENEDSESEYMLIKLPKGIESDEKIDARTTDKIHALILKMKRDSDLFHERNAMHFKEFKELTEASPPARTEEGTSEPVLSPTQPFFRDPVFHHYIDSLTKMTKNVKFFSEDVPPFEDTNNVNTEIEQQNEYADVIRNVERDITDLTDNVIRDVEDDGDLGQFNEEGLEENEREDEVVGGMKMAV